MWAWCSGAVLAVLQPWSFRVQVHVLVHMLLLQHLNGEHRNCGLGAVVQRWLPCSRGRSGFRCMHWCTCCFRSTSMGHAVTVGVQRGAVVQCWLSCSGGRSGFRWKMP